MEEEERDAAAAAAAGVPPPLRLGDAQLAAIRARGGVDVPNYDRSAVGMGIVHLGVGNFHRSHQAVYIDDLLSNNNNASMHEWGICGAGLLDSDSAMAAAMREQDHLYTLLVRGPAGPHKPRIISSMLGFIHATREPGRLLDQMADPHTRVVTLTITEKGYHYDANTRTLDWDHPNVQHDLTNINNPTTAIGYIVSALARRRDNNIPSFTVMSCDNLPGNGRITRDVTLQFAQRIDTTLATWIQQHTCFPNSMVDRITPATSDSDRHILTQQHGLIDAWPVPAEDYIQWVIEDKFSMGRPPWEELRDNNVLVVGDVEPYELMKLRMLNGGHSAMCYIGYLAGMRLVHEAMAEPNMHTFVRTYMTQVMPTLPEVPGIDVLEYRDKLLERFGNKYIGDQIIRLTQDGTPKLRGYAIPCVYQLLDTKKPFSALALAIAGWLRYMTGLDENNNNIHILDPLKDQLQPLAAACADSNTLDPKPFLEVAFGKRVLAEDATRFCDEVAEQLRLLVNEGATRTLQRLARLHTS